MAVTGRRRVGADRAAGGPPDGGEPLHPDRRRFLGMAGVGAAVAGTGMLVPGELGDLPPPWEVDVRDGYGATGDGETDDAPALQAAFTDLGAEPDRTGHPQGVVGGRLLIPPGEYVLGSTVRIHRFAGIVQGTGVGMPPVPNGAFATGQGTVLRWAGPPGEPMFEVTDSAYLQIRDLRFLGRDDGRPGVGIRFHKERGHSQGTNGELLVSDCVFGYWPWTGTDKGRIDCGIELSGHNGDNDQFRIVRCSFLGADRGEGTTGVRVASTQSIWGSLTDCFFNRMTAGLVTEASTTAVNPQFNSCGTDIEVRSTARLDILGWQSEHSSRLARLDRASTLRADGGTVQVDGKHMAPGNPLVDAVPSGNRQTIRLAGMLFTYPTSDEYPDGLTESHDRPDIRFGPEPDTATTSGFRVSVEDCIGLSPEQCTLVEPLAGDSRGTVEWHSRGAGIHQFRNELRGDDTPGTRRRLATDAWDPPVPGTS